MKKSNPRTFSYRCYAKVNLILRVLRKRPDGYHDIDSLMQTVDLADRVTLELGGEGLDLTCSDPALGGERNLAWKAARLLRDAAEVREGLKISIDKGIPVAAGLGGGSTDAAGVLRALALHYGLEADGPLLAALALDIGSDVPYLLAGGPARVRGRGEIVEPLGPKWRDTLHDLNLVTVTPSVQVRSSWAYRGLRMGLTGRAEHDNILWLDSAIADITSLAGALENDLEAPVSRDFPIVGDIKTKMLELGALGAVMSGSGPTVLAIVESRAQAERMAERFAAEGHRAFALRTTGSAASACD